jgi:hypothetical protein
VNYFEELNLFWRTGITSYLTPNASLLYLSLLDVANSRHWPEYIALKSSSLEERTGVEKRDTLHDARAKLKLIGLITFESKQGAKITAYKILGVENALRVLGILPNLPENRETLPEVDRKLTGSYPEVDRKLTGSENAEVNSENVSETPKKKRNTKEINNNKSLFMDFVFLTAEEHQKLIDQFGEQKTSNMIERLNSYGHQKPKKFKEYASHYHTILAWERKDKEGQAVGRNQRYFGKNKAGLRPSEVDWANEPAGL